MNTELLIQSFRTILSFSLEIIIAIGGLAAFVIYGLEQRQKFKIAATIIVEQINYIENLINKLRATETNRGIYKKPRLMSENYWERYKILFIKKMRRVEIKEFDTFLAMLRK